MAKTELYLIRHGQSLGNVACRFLGHTDLDLSPLGYRQAERCGEFLKEIPVHRIYSSDLMRAYHTALPTARLHGLPVERKEGLREIFAGDWENQRDEDILAKNPEEFDRWVNDTGISRPIGGESVGELAERFLSAVEKIAEENPGKTVFVFAHATPIRLMGALWQGLSVKEVKQIPWPGNCSVTHARYENGAFSLLEYARGEYLKELSARLPDEA